MTDQVIRGGRELNAFLQTLPAKIEANILRSALRAGAKVYQAEVKQNLTSNSSVYWGELLASVRVSVRLKDGQVVATVKAGNKKAYYWGWVEFGTQPHTITAKGGALVVGGTPMRSVQHPGAQPKAYMRPAFDARSEDAIAAVAAQIRKRLTKEGINVPAP